MHPTSYQKKSSNEIQPVSTSHGIGVKQVLLANSETATAITQIARTCLKAGEGVEIHSHPTMEEFFLFQTGDALVTINDKRVHCAPGDFLQIIANTPHTIQALTDIEVITIGCAI